MSFLALFQTAAVTQRIVDQAADFFQRWHSSQAIDINDAILAATALETGGMIYTLNRKHFPMPEVAVQKAW